jgi:hypothetical protein
MKFNKLIIPKFLWKDKILFCVAQLNKMVTNANAWSIAPNII